MQITFDTDRISDKMRVLKMLSQMSIQGFWRVLSPEFKVLIKRYFELETNWVRTGVITDTDWADSYKTTKPELKTLINILQKLYFTTFGEELWTVIDGTANRPATSYIMTTTHTATLRSLCSGSENWDTVQGEADPAS